MAGLANTLVIVALFSAGCSTPSHTTETLGLDAWAAFRACTGGFANGDPVVCEQRAEVVEPTPTIPSGWVPTGSGDKVGIDQFEFYKKPNLSNPTSGLQDLGLWFSVTRRDAGDYASPHEPIYGGFLRIDGGVILAWHGAANQGFLVYPEPVNPGVPIWGTGLAPEAELLIYVPVINSEDPVVATGTFEPIWSPAAIPPADSGVSVNAVLAGKTEAGPLFMHDGMPGVGRLGFTHGTAKDNTTFHVYLIQSLRGWPVL